MYILTGIDKKANVAFQRIEIPGGQTLLGSIEAGLR